MKSGNRIISFSKAHFLPLILLFIFQALFYFPVRATHNRAGEIIYTHVPGAGFLYDVTIVTYTKASSTAADRDSLIIFWGDGTFDTLARTVKIPIGNDVQYNEYSGQHQYTGIGTYVLSMMDPNRINEICNINSGNSENEPFYIEDTLKILNPAFFGFNSSPILLNAPVDYANTFQTFTHNPNAYDPDGDSLSFEFIVPRIAPTVPVNNYVEPHLIPGTPAGNTFTINSATGEIVWSKPVFCCIVNFALLIREFRSGICIGTMVRDMEVIVGCETNNAPIMADEHDTCVVAGSVLTIEVFASDMDAGQWVTITSNGGPYEVLTNPAQFDSNQGLGTTTGTFEWNTHCEHIRKPFYQVVFKAEDSYTVPLTDLESWLITIVGPPPEDVTAEAQGNNILVEWNNPYTCETASRFIGFSVWRREGSNPFIRDTCEVGLEGKGYTMLAEHLSAHEYSDQDVEQGTLYCYRILAEFADTGLSQIETIYYNNVYSLPSDEACAQLTKDIPVITNVSVGTTDFSSGEMYIAWSKPNAGDLDTIANPPPYKYVIWRSEGFPGGSMNRIDSIEANSFFLLSDSNYNDSGLNTSGIPYTYKVGFYSNNLFLGETELASSIYLSLTGIDNAVVLNWNEVVPWDNDYYIIYRKNSFNQFEIIDTSFSRTYTDAGLANGTEQCYKVESVGNYSAPGFIDPIRNFSQETCAVPIDTIGPCAPVLTVNNLCSDPDFSLPNLVNQLDWNNPNLTCANDVIGYNIYFAPTSAQPFSLLQSITEAEITLYNHEQLTTIEGCYAVAAIDSYSNEGIWSNVVCTKVCPIYELPNVFTPNADEKNDLYHPFLPYRFVDRVEMKIFDQWGKLVFETTDPFIGWNGKDISSGKELPEAVYYYVCHIYQGGRQVLPRLSGYIHIYR